jgi:hypothetical protein
MRCVICYIHVAYHYTQFLENLKHHLSLELEVEAPVAPYGLLSSNPARWSNPGPFTCPTGEVYSKVGQFHNIEMSPDRGVGNPDNWSSYWWWHR